MHPFCFPAWCSKHERMQRIGHDAHSTQEHVNLLKTLKTIFPYIPSELQKTVMAALFLSKLDYCNALFLGIDKTQINKLQSLQNAAARLLLRIPREESVSAGVKSLHWLPIKKRVEFKALCLVHKALYGGGAEDIQKLFPLYVPSRYLRSANQGLIKTKKIKRVRWGGRAFSYCAAKLWNNLPLALKQQQSLIHFRKLLKTWLFMSA